MKILIALLSFAAGCVFLAVGVEYPSWARFLLAALLCLIGILQGLHRWKFGP